MSREFDRLYAATERPSIPPERLLRGPLLQVFYSIRSELLLMDHARTGLHAAGCAESQPTRWTRDRRPHDTARGLRDEAACPATHRTRVRLVEDNRLDAQGQTPRPGEVEWLVVFASPRSM